MTNWEFRKALFMDRRELRTETPHEAWRREPLPNNKRNGEALAQLPVPAGRSCPRPMHSLRFARWRKVGAEVKLHRSVLKDLRKIPVIEPSAADLALEQLLGFIFWGNAEPVPKYRGR